MVEKSLIAGNALQKALAEMSPAERPLFVQWLEQTGRAEGSLEKLRAVKEWRQMQTSPPTSTTPPEAG